MASETLAEDDLEETVASLCGLSLRQRSASSSDCSPVVARSSIRSQGPSSSKTGDGVTTSPVMRDSRVKHRWRPYSTPTIKSIPSSDVSSELQVLFELYTFVQMYYSKLALIRLKGDVEALRLCIFEMPRSAAMNCSLQASRPPDPHIDELAEYFEHFVNVRLKMSALAESMYA